MRDEPHLRVQLATAAGRVISKRNVNSVLGGDGDAAAGAVALARPRNLDQMHLPGIKKTQLRWIQNSS
jgi:hypothetical protein